jgi:hypothetical protein
MSQIKITVLKQGTPSRNVITCCLFTVGDAYRNFEQYIGNMKRFIIQTEHLKGFELRIYTDDTGKDIAMKVSEGVPRVTVLHYDCPPFREGRGHIGMFGTLVRFLPIFEDLDTVWSSDIDIPDRYLDQRILESVKKTKVDFMLSTFVCYNEKVWGRKYTILAGRFISRIQFPRALLTRYLNMYLEGKLGGLIEKINEQNIRKPPSLFPYGMDELFLNTSVYNWMKSHDLKVLTQVDYFTGMFAFDLNLAPEKKILNKYLWFPNQTNFEKIKKMYEKYIPQFIEAHPCYNELLTLLPTFKHNFIKNTVIQGSDL